MSSGDCRSHELAWCHDNVQDVSRTFALTVDVLDEPMSSYVCVGYLLCRVADTIEDAPPSAIPPARKAELLETYAGALDPADDRTVEAFADEVDPSLGDSDAEWSVVAHADRVFAAYEEFPDEVQAAMGPPALELVEGLAGFVGRRDSGGVRIRSKEDLDEYCHYAAGTVGRLVTNLATLSATVADEEQLYDRAHSFGLLLQLVNVAKDVHGDFVEEDNVYLPATWLREEDVAQSHVVDSENEAAVAAVVERTAAYARTFLDDAAAYLRTVPLEDGNTLAAWAVPYLLAVGTLRELTARPEDAVTGAGVKVSRSEVGAVVAAMTGSPERERVDALREEIERGPLGE